MEGEVREMSDELVIPQEVIEGAAKDCRCCPDCEVTRPCDGCLAGGICDHFRCTCGETEDDEDNHRGEDGYEP